MKRGITKLLFIALLFGTIFSGCRKYSVLSRHTPKSPITNKINPLDPKYNGNSFSYSYIFISEVNQNISQIYTIDTTRLDKANMGTIEYRITKDESVKNPLISFFCFFTSLPFRIPALVGIPVGHRRAKVNIDVDVRDANGNLVKTYSGKGKHVSFITCWWGYHADDAWSKAHDKAFTKALYSVKAQINQDAAFLNSKLPTAVLSDQDLAAKKFIQEGNENYKNKNYPKAIENYLKALDIIKEPKQTHAKFLFRLGESYYKTEKDEDEKNVIKYLQMALNLDPKVDAMAPLELYLMYKNSNDYVSAVKWLDYALDNFSDLKKDVIKGWKQQCQDAIPQIAAGAVLKDKPINVQVRNLGETINGKFGDYFPSITADESMLLFTSRREGSTGGLVDGKYDEDLWYCLKNDSGEWTTPHNFGTPVNTKNNNGIASFTGDGQYVVCCRCNEPDGVGSCDIYGATLLGNTWSTPVNLGDVINDKEWDAQVSISADGKILVWSSARPGGYGNEDIWMSKKNQDGTWSQPKNIGSTINTSGSEFSPYLHPDGKTLYFSSNNHSPRIGGFDIYKTTMKEDGTFTTPENLGYPINSEKNDLYFVLSPSGLKGYFASNRNGGFGEEDIYEITFPQEMKSKLTTFVGYVLDEETKQPIESTITIDDLDSSKMVGTYVSFCNR